MSVEAKAKHIIDLLTLEEVAIRLRYTGKTAARRVKVLVEKEGLPYLKRGRTVLIPREGFEQWLADQTKQQTGKPKQEPTPITGRWDGKWR